MGRGRAQMDADKQLSTAMRRDVQKVFDRIQFCL